jgi:hypothetical protein
LNKIEKFLYNLLYNVMPASEIESLIEHPISNENASLAEYATALASRLKEVVPTPEPTPTPTPIPVPTPVPAPQPIPTPTPTPSPSFDPKAFSTAINLAAYTYYSREWAFVDVMKSARTRNEAGYLWDGTAGLTYDTNGYPKAVAVGQNAWTLVCVGMDGKYPAGQYSLSFDGDGDVAVRFDATPVTYKHNGIGRFSGMVTVNPANGQGVEISIKRSNAANPIRNIRFIYPGFESTPDAFHPEFLAKLAPFSTIRFMDWGRTNGSPIKTWADRQQPNMFSYTFQNRGIPYERMIELCNKIGKHMWICIPHMADDDFVSQLAGLIKRTLSPDLKVFIEYSNEVWNGGFAQHTYMKNLAATKGLQWYQQYAIRSSEIFHIFEGVFGGLSRIVRVLGSQSANAWIGEQILKTIPAGSADCLAIAPYFGGNLGRAADAPTTRVMTVDQILDACNLDIDKQIGLMDANKAKATQYGVSLIGYEGGQHLAGVGGAENDTQLTALFIAANRHARMGELYTKYLNAAKSRLGTFCLFNFCIEPTKWGSWGLIEYQNQNDSPKYNSVASFVKGL